MKSLEEYKNSKYRRDRLIWFISIQSPHNLWRAEGELDNWLEEEILQALDTVSKPIEEIGLQACGEYDKDCISCRVKRALDLISEYKESLKQEEIWRRLR